MRIASFLPMRRVASAGLIAGILAAGGGSDGRWRITGPTAIAPPTSLSASAHNHDGADVAPSASPQLPLLLTKTCDAIDHCTVITSQAGPIPVGSEAFYSGPLLESRTTSGIVIRTPSGDTATGHGTGELQNRTRHLRVHARDGGVGWIPCQARDVL